MPPATRPWRPSALALALLLALPLACEAAASPASPSRPPSTASASPRRPFIVGPYDKPRTLALEVLRDVQKGAALDEALRVEDVARLSPKKRTFVRQLATTTVRHFAQLDAIIDSHGELPPSRPLRDLLRLGVAQLLLLDVPEYAAVSSTLTVAVAAGLDGYKGLVNKRLRSISEAAARHAESELADPGLAVPAWLRKALEPIADEAAMEGIGRAMLLEPALDLTLRLPLDAPAAEVARWAARLNATVVGGRTIRLRADLTGDLEAMVGYAEGRWWVQDLAASTAVRALASALDLRGARVADLCAAPGGKTLQLLANGARVSAVDRSAVRLERLRDNLARCAGAGSAGELVELVKGDGAAWALAQGARGATCDAVLVDAPCTGTGLVRRHPGCVASARKDIDMRRLVREQRALLHAAAALVRPGGVVVYSTCSLLPVESEEQTAAFLLELAATEGGPTLERLALRADELPAELVCAINGAGELRILPSMCADVGGVDGFFVSRFRRTS